MLPNNSWTILWLSSYILVSIFYILLLFDDRKVICSQRNQSTSKESITRVHVSFFCHYIHIAKVKWFDFNFKTKRIYPMKLISNYAILMKALTVRIPYVSIRMTKQQSAAGIKREPYLYDISLKKFNVLITIVGIDDLNSVFDS